MALQMQRPKYKTVQISKTVKLKSGLEEAIYNFLLSKDVLFSYETLKISFDQPTQKRTYTPDFPIKYSFIAEGKGSFNSADRKKHKLIKQQHPKYDIRFIFSNSKTKIGKKSKTTYGMWCDLFGFKYHCIQSTKKYLPDNWLKEIKEKQNGKKIN